MRFEDNRIYRVKAVAEALDVSVNTIYRAIESGQLDALKLGTGKGTLRLAGSALNLYLDACGQAAYEAHVVGTEPVAGTEDIELGEAA